MYYSNQFYVEAIGEPLEESPVPIDNFVYYRRNKITGKILYSIRMSFTAEFTYVTYGKPGKEKVIECISLPQAFYEMARILKKNQIF